MKNDETQNRGERPHYETATPPRAQVGSGKTILLVVAALVLMGLIFCCFEFVQEYARATSFAPAF